MNPGTSEIAAYLESHFSLLPVQKGVQQMAHCTRTDCHAHGDRDASLSVNVEKRVLCCHACGLEGSILSLWDQLGWERPSWLSNGRSRGEMTELPAGHKAKPKHPPAEVDGRRRRCYSRDGGFADDNFH